MEGYVNIPKKVVNALNASTDAVVEITDVEIVKELSYIFNLNKAAYIEGFLFSDGVQISGFLDKAITANGWALTGGYSGNFPGAIANFVISKEQDHIGVVRRRGA